MFDSGFYLNCHCSDTETFYVILFQLQCSLSSRSSGMMRSVRWLLGKDISAYLSHHQGPSSRSLLGLLDA